MELAELRATLGEPRRGTGAGQKGPDNGVYVARKTRGGDADAAADLYTPGMGDHTDTGCGRSHKPLFYSVRPKTMRPVDEIRGIGIELPAGREVTAPNKTSSIASLDSVQGGRATGWACHRSSKSSRAPATLVTPSAHIYAVVDDTVVASVDVVDTYGDLDLSADIRESCLTKGEADPGVNVFKFDIGLPPLPQGIHTLRVLIRDVGAPDSSDSSIDETNSNNLSGSRDSVESSSSSSTAALVEAFHSPLMFEETVNEPSMAAVIKRKDEIITHRNNLLTKLWNEVHTQLPWRRYEQDAADIPLEGGAPPDLLAFIIVRSNPGKQEQRSTIRNTWGKTLDDNQMMSRFFVETQFSGPHKDALDREMSENSDIVPLALHADRSDEIDGVLSALHYAVKHHDASFYFVVSDDLLVLPLNLRKYLTKKLNDGNRYMGCMKSGAIVTEDGKGWYEPQHGRFGDGKDKSYPMHARSAMFGFSRLVARHLARSREVLSRYAHPDTTIGTWMLGLDVEYDDNELFCTDWRSCAAGKKPLGAKDPTCEGMCHPQNMEEGWKSCGADAPPG